MKVIVCLFIALSLFYNPCEAQSNPQGRATYQRVSGKTTILIDTWFTSTEYMYTYRNSNNISYDLVQKYERDSSATGQEIKKMLAADALQKQFWYGRLGTNTIYYSFWIDGEGKFCVHDTIKPINWQLTDDTATKAGLLCQKAFFYDTKNNLITAWFAPSIPVSTAIFSFRGLPGLLVSLENETTHANITMTELDWPLKTPVTIRKPDDNAINVSVAELNARLEKHNKDAQRMVDYYKKQMDQQQTNNNQH